LRSSGRLNEMPADIRGYRAVALYGPLLFKSDTIELTMKSSVWKIIALLLVFSAGVSAQLRIEVSFPATLQAGPITGRVYVNLGPTGQLFGADVNGLLPDAVAVVDSSAAGFPILSLKDVPPGDYSIKATLCIYTEFRRADGHAIWAHLDRGEGQSPESSPGNLFSNPQTVHIDPAHPSTVRLTLGSCTPSPVRNSTRRASGTVAYTSWRTSSGRSAWLSRRSAHCSRSVPSIHRIIAPIRLAPGRVRHARR
jgi:hypothetical protein